MNKLTLALLASAAALAIAPAAMAGTISAGSSFTVIGDFSGTPSLDPTLTDVAAYNGVGTFTGITGYITLTSGSGTDTYTLNSGVIGDTFTVTGTDGDTTTFTVNSVNYGVNDSASGFGTLTFTGDTPITDAYWSEAITSAGDVSFTFDTTVTPEPSSLVLLGTGLLGLAFVAFRKAKSTGAILSM